MLFQIKFYFETYIKYAMKQHKTFKQKLQGCNIRRSACKLLQKQKKKNRQSKNTILESILTRRGGDKRQEIVYPFPRYISRNYYGFFTNYFSCFRERPSFTSMRISRLGILHKIHIPTKFDKLWYHGTLDTMRK